MSAPQPSLGADLLSVVARLNRWATYQASLPVSPALARLLGQIDAMGAARIGDLARADHCSQPTMTTQVQRLEESGWVRRTPDPADSRAVLISLSAEGSRLLRDVRRARADVFDPLIDRLSQVEQRRLQRALATLTELLNASVEDASTPNDVQEKT
ncbi:MAG: MarR family winged helix-turn-helix transcriptional regulator [Nocardioidaceae bacterium]